MRLWYLCSSLSTPTQFHHQKVHCLWSWVQFLIFLYLSHVKRKKVESKENCVKKDFCVTNELWACLSFHPPMFICSCILFTYFLGQQRWCCPLHISNRKGSHAPTLTQLICLQRQEREIDRSQVNRQRFINQLYTVSASRLFRLRGRRQW